jgi:hypothetical protein
MAKAKKKVTKKVAKSGVPADTGMPPETRPRHPHLKRGDINRHGGRVTSVDEERGIMPHSINGQDALSESDKEMVSIDIPYHIKFAGKQFTPGPYRVPMHVARELKRICYKKAEADKSVHIGKKLTFDKTRGRRRTVETVNNM